MFMDRKNQYSENEYTTQGNLQIQCNPYQIANGIFHRTRTTTTKKISEFVWRHKRPWINKAILKKKNRKQASWLQIILQSYSYQNSMVLAQKYKYRSMEQDRKPWRHHQKITRISMNIVKLQDIYRYVKLTHINPLHPYTLTMRKQKEKLRKKSHSPLWQKE